MRSKARVARCRKIMYVRMFWQMVCCWANHAKLWDVWLIRSLSETKHYGNLTESDFWILCARTIHVSQRKSNCRTRNLMCHFCTVILFWPQKRVISYLMRPILIIRYQNFLRVWENLLLTSVGLKWDSKNSSYVILEVLLFYHWGTPK